MEMPTQVEFTLILAFSRPLAAISADPADGADFVGQLSGHYHVFVPHGCVTTAYRPK